MHNKPGWVQQLGPINRSADLPPYRQIAGQLREAIQHGDLRPGDQIPSEADLTNHFGVARMTARQAVGELRHAGLVSSEHGRGVFVAPQPPCDGPAHTLSLDDIVALAQLIEQVIGRRLSPDESSRLKTAYQASTPPGATLHSIIDNLPQTHRPPFLDTERN